MATPKKVQDYSHEFVNKLGEFIKKEKVNALSKGLALTEFRAVSSTAFEILGRKSKEWTKRAGLK